MADAATPQVELSPNAQAIIDAAAQMQRAARLFTDAEEMDDPSAASTLYRAAAEMAFGAYEVAITGALAEMVKQSSVNEQASELLDRSGAALERATREMERLTKVTIFCAAAVPVEAWGLPQ